MFINVHVNVHVHTYIHTYRYIHTYIHTYIHSTHIHTYIHTSIHIHTRIHTHEYTCTCLLVVYTHYNLMECDTRAVCPRLVSSFTGTNVLTYFVSPYRCVSTRHHRAAIMAGAPEVGPCPLQCSRRMLDDIKPLYSVMSTDYRRKTACLLSPVLPGRLR